MNNEKKQNASKNENAKQTQGVQKMSNEKIDPSKGAFYAQVMKDLGRRGDAKKYPNPGTFWIIGIEQDPKKYSALIRICFGINAKGKPSTWNRKARLLFNELVEQKATACRWDTDGTPNHEKSFPIDEL